MPASHDAPWPGTMHDIEHMDINVIRLHFHPIQQYVQQLKGSQMKRFVMIFNLLQVITGPFSIDLTTVPQYKLTSTLKILVEPLEYPVKIKDLRIEYCGQEGK